MADKTSIRLQRGLMSGTLSEKKCRVPCFCLQKHACWMAPWGPWLFDTGQFPTISGAMETPRFLRGSHERIRSQFLRLSFPQACPKGGATRRL